MPAFRGALDEQERWALVSYLRSLAAQHAAR
jgi:mono/diheme cytochrome c family protein